MPRPLYIYTSSKGGVGKTLQAICTSLFHLNLGQDILVCDFNLFNSDLFQIFKCLVDNEKSTINREGLVFQPMKTPGRAYIVHPLDLYQLPMNGIGGFFNMLNTVLRFCNENNFEPHALVVDTGYHYANFDIKEYVEKIKLMPEAAEYTPYFWFTWTIAALQREEELAALEKTVMTLRKSNPGWGEFSDTQNLIHVFNPHALIPRIGLNIFRKILSKHGPEEYEVKNYSKLYNLKKVTQGISMRFMADTIVKSLGASGKSNINADQLTTEEHIADLVRPLLELGQRPRNVFAIPFYVESLISYTDSFSFKAKMKAEDLRSHLKVIYDVISKYLSEL